MRTTWKFTAFANVGTRTTAPATTGTPSKSSSIRSGAMIAGAAPTHKGAKRTETAWACSTGATVTCSCNPAPQLLRVVPSIWITPCWLSSARAARTTETVAPVIFNTSPARAPMRVRSAGARRAIAWPISSTRASATRSATVVARGDVTISFMTAAQPGACSGSVWRMRRTGRPTFVSPGGPAREPK